MQNNKSRCDSQPVIPASISFIRAYLTLSYVELVCNMHQVNIPGHTAALYGNIRTANQVENDDC